MPGELGRGAPHLCSTEVGNERVVSSQVRGVGPIMKTEPARMACLGTLMCLLMCSCRTQAVHSPLVTFDGTVPMGNIVIRADGRAFKSPLYLTPGETVNLGFLFLNTGDSDVLLRIYPDLVQTLAVRVYNEENEDDVTVLRGRHSGTMMERFIRLWGFYDDGGEAGQISAGRYYKLAHAVTMPATARPGQRAKIILEFTVEYYRCGEWVRRRDQLERTLDVRFRDNSSLRSE